MTKYVKAVECAEKISEKFGIPLGDLVDVFAEIPAADVAPTAEVFEEVDKFRTDLIDKFIDLCRGNDYNKLTLLKIGDVVDEMYDKRIAELEKKYAADEEIIPLF